MLTESSKTPMIQIKRKHGIEIDLTKNIEVIQIKSKCQNDDILNNYVISSNSHLCKTLEEEDINDESFNEEWNAYRVNEEKNINELETDVKTPNNNHLSTKDQFIINTKHSNNSFRIIEEETQRKNKYNANKVYKDITSYCCSYHDKYCLKEFLFHPLLQDKTLYCNIKLIGNDSNSIKDGNYKDYYYQAVIQGNDFPLMKITNAKTTASSLIRAMKYYVYYDRNELIGKIKTNFFSTSFTIFKKKHKTNYNQGTVQYKLNPFGLFGLRKMEINITQANGSVIAYMNKKANWIQEHREYRLDFNSRVKKASSKNFIIENDNKEKLLQFGKIDNDTYAMDFQSPLSPFQAFSICLTSIVSKVLCE